MSKLIVYITGKPLMDGYRRREFVWSPPHNCYLYGGAEIDISEFNEKYAKAIKNNSDLYPKVKVVSIESQPAEPVATFEREMTADEAEEVLARERPDRLKKKTGPKPQVMEVG